MVEILPFYVEIHNTACDDFSLRFGFEQNMPLMEMITEFRFRNKDKEDTLMAPQHAIAFGFSDEDEMEHMHAVLRRINDFLLGQFSAVQLRLLRYTLEFGRIYLSDNPMDTRLVLIDEISLDTCRVLDLVNDVRLDVHGIEAGADPLKGYHEIAKRFGIVQNDNLILFEGNK
jgi:phosphoribosylaminoimidazole-succinocarboxamide synthase